MEPIIPFAEHGDADTLPKSHKRRARIIREFIGYDIANLKTLDIGAKNKLGEVLGIRDNTLDADLNVSVSAPDHDYDLILCSEIFEHICNPYLMMRRIMELLKPGGVCILSTPVVGWIIWLPQPNHFTEYSRISLGKFFRYMGFEPEKYRTTQIWDLSFMFYGVRPLIRVLFKRHQMWMLRKPCRP